jgi:hypothetical protein
VRRTSARGSAARVLSGGDFTGVRGGGVGRLHTRSGGEATTRRLPVRCGRRSVTRGSMATWGGGEAAAVWCAQTPMVRSGVAVALDTAGGGVRARRRRQRVRQGGGRLMGRRQLGLRGRKP